MDAMKKYKIAVLDDYQNVALVSADWSVLRDRAEITVFQNHLADPEAVIERLLPFDVVCVMRERTPLPAGRHYREASVRPPATGPQLHTPCPLPRVDKKEHWLCKAASSPSPSGPSWNVVSVIAKEELLGF